MKGKYKILLTSTMTLALLAGFMHALWPETVFSLKRIHIFFFNLVSGGSLILYYTKDDKKVTKLVQLFFILSSLYALCAASSWYIPALLLSLPLFLLVESVRIKKYGFFPWDFFKAFIPVSEKFKQAALLSLSYGILTASLVVLNNQFWHLVQYEKLKLDVFFLGYSFPISLITMSVMFHFMEQSDGGGYRILKEISFWVVNLGVITFFVFIIIEWFVPEMTMAISLFLSVCLIFVLFIKTAPKIQQRTFLISGMAFLLFTGISGMFYIMKYFIPFFSDLHQPILLMHAMISLYGWNLIGLFIIICWDQFPLQLNSRFVISLHWLIVLILIPIAKYYPILAVLPVLAYVLLLKMVFWGQGKIKVGDG